MAVDHMEGADEIKLTKDDRDAAGEDHYIPLAWVVHAEMKVHLSNAATTLRRGGTPTEDGLIW
jgi:hypothetical protein